MHISDPRPAAPCGGGRWAWLLCLPLLLVAAARSADRSSSDSGKVGAGTYARAERFLYWNAAKYIKNADVDYTWIGPDTFTYARQTEAGREFVVVDAAKGTKRPAFDHALLARALSTALRRPIDAQNLPFGSFAFEPAGRSIRMSIDGRDWSCSLQQALCAVAAAGERRDELVSPDGKWAAYVKGSNVWVRSRKDHTERALTSDGQAHDAYGSVAGPTGLLGISAALRAGPPPPMAIWSPDSKRLLTDRFDEREVLDLNLLETVPATGIRPVVHTYRYALPEDGEKHIGEVELMVFDMATGKRTNMQHERLPAPLLGPIEVDRAWWSNDSRTVYVIPQEWGAKRAQLLAMDANTGATRGLIEEQSRSYVEIGGAVTTRAVRTLSDGRVIWYSERDDWGHLYLYSPEGKLIRRITSGPWKVFDILRVDEAHGRIYFTAVGRETGEDPYQQHLYSINLDGSGLRLLTAGNADHEIRFPTHEILRKLEPGFPGPEQSAFSPSGRYFIETYSRPDLTPVSVVRDADGRLVQTLERGDISALKAGGFTMPEPFNAVSADGHTKLYGTIFRPSDFDATKKYPIIETIYPGPNEKDTEKSFVPALWGRWFRTQDLAELGFIVVTVDGRGTPYRSKSFHDISYGNMGQAGNLEDHMAALRQLAARYSYMDIDRVGINGYSGGGFASTRAILQYPDFYKVAVSGGGDHDLRLYSALWLPTYQGTSKEGDYDDVQNARLAANLKGKLLLIHGELDDNVHPAQTMRVVDALIGANKDFDFLLMPGQDHTMSGKAAAPYYHRKQWDYFVRNLLGKEPPANYQISHP
jgi:dipeptidyl aminopeptidase/acylaminoacyl peptidase